MSLSTADCCVLNNGPGSWAFEELARQLAAALWVDVSSRPRKYNYLLLVEEYDVSACDQLFIPFRAVELAADKRLLAGVFANHGVPTPMTFLADTEAELWDIVRSHPTAEWCLKYPLGCGASGHRLLSEGVKIPADWPRPYVVQEFIRLARPEVYRTYAAGGVLFGWVARRFPEGIGPSPWVAHARGARYVNEGEPPADATRAARAALAATDLLNSFGCVDLLCRPSGEWVVLEVGTDGMYNHVDRDIGSAGLEAEIQRRIAEAFWAGVGRKPWEPGAWRPKAP